jgi:hypothetical protein
VLLVDYPGFNLRFAAAAKALGLKVLYYVCPQVWAWNRARIPRMAAVVDRLLAIFPFEPDVFAGTSLRVDSSAIRWWTKPAGSVRPKRGRIYRGAARADWPFCPAVGVRKLNVSCPP